MTEEDQIYGLRLAIIKLGGAVTLALRELATYAAELTSEGVVKGGRSFVAERVPSDL